MKKQELTEIQKKILDILKSYISKHSIPPTIKEISALCGLSSTSSVHHQLSCLEEKGYIVRDKTKSRSIKLTGKRVSTKKSSNTKDVKKKDTKKKNNFDTTKLLDKEKVVVLEDLTQKQDVNNINILPEISSELTIEENVDTLPEEDSAPTVEDLADHAGDFDFASLYEDSPESVNNDSNKDNLNIESSENLDDEDSEPLESMITVEIPQNTSSELLEELKRIENEEDDLEEEDIEESSPLSEEPIEEAKEVENLPIAEEIEESLPIEEPIEEAKEVENLPVAEEIEESLPIEEPIEEAKEVENLPVAEEIEESLPIEEAKEVDNLPIADEVEESLPIEEPIEEAKEVENLPVAEEIEESLPIEEPIEEAKEVDNLPIADEVEESLPIEEPIEEAKEVDNLPVADEVEESLPIEEPIEEAREVDNLPVEDEVEESLPIEEPIEEAKEVDNLPIADEVEKSLPIEEPIEEAKEVENLPVEDEVEESLPIEEPIIEEAKKVEESIFEYTFAGFDKNLSPISRDIFNMPSEFTGVSDAMLYEVNTDELENFGVYSGDIALIEYNSEPKSGDIIFAVYERNVILRQVKFLSHIAILSNGDSKNNINTDRSNLVFIGVLKGLFRTAFSEENKTEENKQYPLIKYVNNSIEIITYYKLPPRLLGVSEAFLFAFDTEDMAHYNVLKDDFGIFEYMDSPKDGDLALLLVEGKIILRIVKITSDGNYILISGSSEIPNIEVEKENLVCFGLFKGLFRKF